MRLITIFFISIIFLPTVAGAADPKVEYFDNLQSGWNLYGTTETIPKSQSPIELKQKIDGDLQNLLNNKVLW